MTSSLFPRAAIPARAGGGAALTTLDPSIAGMMSTRGPRNYSGTTA